MQAAALAALVDGALHGPDRSFSGVAPLSGAGPEHASFALRAPTAPCTAGVLLIASPLPGHTCVVVADPKLAFITLLQHLFPEAHTPGIHPGAFVHPTAILGEGVTAYPGVWIGPGCQVGAHTILFPNAVLYPGTVVGERCRIHAGVVLGADGFSYHPTAAGAVKVPQVGHVELGDDVEIGPNSTVDRAFLEKTVLGDGVKLDNLVHVGHNSQLGRGVIAAAQAGISGSCEIGDGCLLGGQVGVADHAVIGAGAQLGARAAAHGRLEGGQAYLGVPAMPIRLARRVMATSRRLPQMWRMLQKYERDRALLREEKGDPGERSSAGSPHRDRP